MDIAQFANREPPTPWEGETKIPWADPDFSARMLVEHLNQDHDRASRRQSIVEAQVEFLDAQVFGGQQGRVLDLGCGPGLYCKAFAAKGHACTGIDIGPASIEYAREQDSLSEYVLGDIRTVELANGFDLVLLGFGEFNTFSPQEGLELLGRMRDAAWPAGTIVLEVTNERGVRDAGLAPLAWRAVPRSVFSSEPHLILEEHFWFEEERSAVSRYFIVDDEVRVFTDSLLAYGNHDYIELLQEIGARRIQRHPSLAEDATLSFLIAQT